jgi:chromosomal replication initiator protein
MSKKKDIWNQITRNLESKIPDPDFKTWFSRTTLQKLEPGQAVIGVPNKYVSNWLQEKYLPEITKSFKRILKQEPDIYFSHQKPPGKKRSQSAPPIEKRDPAFKHYLDPSMTFHRFIMGKGNRFARTSSIEVAKRSNNDYNPLYIYCHMGLGKTHLLHAIGNYIISNDPSPRIRYLTSDTFTADFSNSSKNKKLHEFRERYCGLDVLLFDDVHLLDNRKRSQEEFLSIFNALHAEKKRVVVAGQRPPTNLKNLDSRLKSRLGSGLITEIQVPDQKTKINIIKNTTKEQGIHIPEDVVFFLANTNNDIKALMKNIIKIGTYASLNQRTINISTVKSFMKGKNKIEIDLDDIKSIMAEYFNISVMDLVSDKKRRSYSYPRQLAMYLARKYTRLSFKEIGVSFGNKDHSTVIYAVQRIEKCKDQKNVQDDLTKIENLLG